jgi:hypothetical protein
MASFIFCLRGWVFRRNSFGDKDRKLIKKKYDKLKKTAEIAYLNILRTNVIYHSMIKNCN